MIKPNLPRTARTWIFKRSALMRQGKVHRLHWGCGPKAAPGWINADILKGRGIDITCDIRDGLPLDESSMDYAVGIHALPEIPYSDIVPALKELHRVIKVGGTLRLAASDFEKAIHAYQTGEKDYFLIPDSDATSLGGKFIVHMLWYGGIRTIFTADFMEEMLLKAGFREVHHCSFKTTHSQFGDGIVELDDRPRESLFIEAVK